MLALFVVPEAFPGAELSSLEFPQAAVVVDVESLCSCGDMGVWRVSYEALGGEEHDNTTEGAVVH
jgi:hypothetical protein